MNPKSCAGVAGAQKMISDKVSGGGWAIIGVGSHSDNSPPFAYTVGLHSLGFPELIMIGLDPRVAQNILNDCAQQIIDQGRSFESTAVVEDLANLPLTIIDADEDSKREYAVQAFNFYKVWNFRLQQLVMPDVNGLFPWQNGFDDQMREIQVVLNTSLTARH